ncbi:uncharacterized protein CBL_21364, partial [Carabus blaptoides fortunei]
SKEYVVADLGCGDARLSKSVPQKVHSFELVANDPSVTACVWHMCRLRITVGIILVAEVESPFDQVDVFIEGLHRYGFVNTWKDLSHSLFYFLEFEKERDIKYENKLPTISLHPCLYKKR